jgi:HlyD family secretion protein
MKSALFTKRRLLWGGAALLVAALLASVYSWQSGRSRVNAQPAYLFASIERGTLENIVSSTGTLAAVETVAVGTQISGTIAKLLVDYNDSVRKGQILAIIDPSLYQAARQEAEAGVSRARAARQQAEEEYERNRPLAEKGYLSAQEFLPNRIAVETARASLSAAEAVLIRAQANLDYTVIRSPIDGTIITRNVDAGQTVAASLNTPTLFVIANDLEQMQIEANVDESDIGQIRQGQEVRFTVSAWPEERFDGSVTQIRRQPTTISNVVNYTVVVRAGNPAGKLLPGMTATVDFVIERAENALLVPNAALRFVPSAGEKMPPLPAGQGRLYRLDPQGQLQQLSVSTGITDGSKVVVSGAELQEGMQVVSGMAPAAKAGKKGLMSFLAPPRGGGR